MCAFWGYWVIRVHLKKHWKTWSWKEQENKNYSKGLVGYLVKNTNKKTEDGKSGLYFLIGKGLVSEDPSKQLNMRKLIGRDAFRGNQTNHISAWCWELVTFFSERRWKWKSIPVIIHRGQMWSSRTFRYHEMSFWISFICFELQATINICVAQARASCWQLHHCRTVSYLLVQSITGN